MPIYRCNQCSFVSEDSTTAIGQKIPCPRCGTACTVYGTVFYVEKLVERYMAALRELKALQQPDTPEPTTEASSAPAALMPSVDVSNTNTFATAEQHAPLQQWFKLKQIEAQFDHRNVDTTGFFDDAAHMLGEGYALFGELIDRIGYAYRKSHSTVNLELLNLSQKDGQALNTLCRQLYSHTFFARYHYQKPEKIIRLTLQTTPVVRQFFEGGWLEWYAFIQAVEQLRTRGRKFSCARGVKVIFPNEDLHELDVVLLPEGQAPICIECKTGEFRRDIDKYLRLRKRLGLERNRFIICATDLTDEQAAGLSAMYELNFVSLGKFRDQLASLI